MVQITLFPLPFQFLFVILHPINKVTTKDYEYRTTDTGSGDYRR